MLLKMDDVFGGYLVYFEFSDSTLTRFRPGIDGETRLALNLGTNNLQVFGYIQFTLELQSTIEH